MILDLESLTYRQAAYAFLDAGYTQLASGDWSLVFLTPHADHVVKLTPFDPAYLIFARLCRENPHTNLPQIRSIISLQRNGFVVETPRYFKREREKQQGFLDVLKATLEEDKTADPEIDQLGCILRKGLRQADNLPYFAGMDWNPDNVLFDGDIPKLVDAFNICGSNITQRLEKGDPVNLGDQAVADFLTIPYHCPFPGSH